MAEYRLKVGYTGGTGTLTITGASGTLAYVEEGTALTFTMVLDAGFTSVDWYVSNVFAFTGLSYSTVMPPRDISVRAVINGNYIPLDDYGVKYTYNKTDINGDQFKVEIEEFGFTGTPQERTIQSATYYWGERGSDIIQQYMVPSRLVLNLIANSTDLSYDSLLTGANRKFRTKLYLNGETAPFFTGFLSPNQLRYELTDTDYQFSVVAIDGLGSLNFIRCEPDKWFSTQPAVRGLAGVLNQTFITKRNLSIACSLWESRMNRTLSPFSQFIPSDACLYENGDIMKYLGPAGIVNQYLFCDEYIKRLTNIFTGRVYLWRDRFYFTRLEDYRSATLKYFNFDGFGESVNSTVKDNGFTFSCLNGADGVDSKPEVVKSIAYNEFTGVLKLGVLQPSTKTADVEYTFEDVDDWYLTSPAAVPPNTYRLNRWDYIRAIPSGQPSSVPSGDTALVQFASSAQFVGCKIWTTSANNGVNDVNISYIELSSQDYGDDLSIVQEASNVFTLSIEFLIQPIGSTLTDGFGAHAFGIMVNVGTKYLYRFNDTEFAWTSTPTVMQFPFLNQNQWNTLTIPEAVVPETGVLVVRLYQLILNSGTRHQYALVMRNFEMKIEENSALVNEEISIKGTTDVGWNLVYPEKQTYQGDTESSESTSALRLDQPLATPPFPVSETWTRDGVESLKLLQFVVLDMANVKGVQPQRQIYGVTADEPDPTVSVSYLGSNFVITYIEFDVYRREWRIELTELLNG